MDETSVIHVAGDALFVTILVTAPILLTALAIGVLVGMVQAATQIQEMTLSFIPKLAGMGFVALLAGPWMLRMLVDWTRELYRTIPTLVG